MKIITKLVILTLSLLLVNADQYCDNFIKQYSTFRNKCSLQSLTITSCCDLRIVSSVSGVYKLNKGTFNSADVYCDMNTTTGGWIVIQRNKKDSSVNFNKNWTDYEKGFGDLNTEFWYGLESMHCLTQRGQWEMRVDYQKTDKTWSYLHYNQFSVGSASEKYLLIIGGFTGVGSDPFAYHNKMKFTTADNENDNWSGGNCATYVRYKSGWWYHTCRKVNLNKQPPEVNEQDVLFGEMKIRPKNCIV